MAKKKEISTLETKENKIDGMTLVLIPSGEFMMGASQTDSLAAKNEKPQVKVVISKSYWMTTTPITQKAIATVLGKDFVRSSFDGDRYPATDLSLEEIFKYCDKVGGRLPTEAEWEWAARAGTEESRPAKPKDFGWFNKNAKELQQVAMKKPNAWGLYDMMGNIVEFTSTPWSFELQGGIDPGIGDRNIEIERTSRSGSYFNAENMMSATSRGGCTNQNKVPEQGKPWTIQNTRGFRYVVST